MELFIDRVEKVLKEKGITKAELAEKVGIRRPTLSEWKKNGAIPSGDVCLRIAGYLGVSAEWLISGREAEERPERITPEERGLLAELRSLSPAQREHISISLGVFMEQNRRAQGKKTGSAE